MMPIIKAEHKKNYTKYLNDIIYDLRMSWQARTILIMLLSLKEDWEFHISEISDRFLIGEFTLKSVAKEWEKYGYLVREKRRGTNGQWAGYKWTLIEKPLKEPSVEKPSTVKQLLDITDREKSLNIDNTDSEEVRTISDDDHDNDESDINYIVKRESTEKRKTPSVEKPSTVPSGGDEEKRPYGRYGKVFLTPKEYEVLKSMYADIDATIEDYTATKTLLGKQCDSDFKELLRKTAGW